jgi:hypothetical protein
MPWKRHVSQGIGLKVSAVCEACGEPFSYGQWISGRAEGTGGLIFATPWESLSQEAQSDFQARLASRFEREDFGYNTCPACGCLQSWQRQSFLGASFGANFAGGCLLWLSAMLALPLLAWLATKLAGSTGAAMVLCLYVPGFSAAAVGFSLLARSEFKKRLADSALRVSLPVSQPQVAFVKSAPDASSLPRKAMTIMLDYLGPSSTTLECPHCKDVFEPIRYRTGLEVACPSCSGEMVCPDRDGVVRWMLNGLWMLFAAFTPVVGLVTSKFVFDMMPQHMRRLTRRGFWIRVLLLQGLSIAFFVIGGP